MMRKIVLVLMVAVTACFGTEAQEVLTLSNSYNLRRAKKDSPLYRPSEPALRVSLGVTRFISVEYNYWLAPWLMLGGGTGFGLEGADFHEYSPSYIAGQGDNVFLHEEADNVYDFYPGLGIPIYIEAELRTPKYKWSLFFNVKIGYSIGVFEFSGFEHDVRPIYVGVDHNGNAVVGYSYVKWQPFFVEAMVGFGYKHFSLSVGLTHLGTGVWSIQLPSYQLSYDFKINRRLH